MYLCMLYTLRHTLISKWVKITPLHRLIVVLGRVYLHMKAGLARDIATFSLL